MAQNTLVMEQEQQDGYYKDKVSSSNEYEEVYYVQVPQNKGLLSCMNIFILALVAFLILAAVKNPSESEARQLVKNAAIEYINKEMRKEVNQDKNNWLYSLLEMVLVPTAYDYMLQTDVDDYIFFSTFSISVTKEYGSKSLVSGIILFGKLIPLKSASKN